MRTAIAVFGLLATAAGATVFNPGPWIVFFHSDNARFLDRSDRWLRDGLARVTAAGIGPAIGYRGCVFRRAAVPQTLDRLDRRRFAATARIVRRQTGQPLTLDQELCARQTGRAAPGVSVMVVTRS